MHASFNKTRKALNALGISLGRTQYEEYKVNFRHGKEITAYYTNDLEDAFQTGLDMANRALDKSIQR